MIVQEVQGTLSFWDDPTDETTLLKEINAVLYQLDRPALEKLPSRERRQSTARLMLSERFGLLDAQSHIAVQRLRLLLQSG